MGASGDDILLSTAAIRVFPFAVECKSRAALSVYKWFDQIADRSNDTVGMESGGERGVVHNDQQRRPIIFAKANHKDPIVILYAKDFINLVKKD